MESHQTGKLDTSGTAKAVVSCFEKLGVSFDMDQVDTESIFLLFNMPINKSRVYHFFQHIQICQL